MEQEKQVNTNRDFTEQSFGDIKFSKGKELNKSMSIVANAPDELQRTIESLGGKADGE